MTLPPSGILIIGYQGTIAQQPAATHLPDGFRYIQTDGVEQYVDSGAWVDMPGTGGGGTIATITSTGASIDITDPSGPTTNLEIDPTWLSANAVTSLDGTGGPLEGAVTLSEGANITLTQVGQNIEIAATSGGLPTGWTQDASDPANVSSNGGNLDLGAGELDLEDGSATTQVAPGAIDINGSAGENYTIADGVGIASTSPAGVPAFSAHADAGATVAFDGGGLPIANTPIVTLQAGPPSTYQTPLVFDTTAITGGLYGWDGSAYQKIGGPL